MPQNFEDENPITLGLFDTVIAWVGTILGLFFYVLPVKMIISLVKKEISYKEINFPMFIMNGINCTLWFAYAIRTNNIQIDVCNGTGGFLTVIYTCIYLCYLGKFQPLRYLSLIGVYLTATFGLFYYFYAILNNMIAFQYVLIFFNILTYIMPGIKILDVIKTKDRSLIPVYISIISALSCICWLTYGLSLKDTSVWFPNILGEFFAIVQIGVWLWITVKYPSESQEKDFENPSNQFIKKKEKEINQINEIELNSTMYTAKVDLK